MKEWCGCESCVRARQKYADEFSSMIYNEWKKSRDEIMTKEQREVVERAAREGGMKIVEDLFKKQKELDQWKDDYDAIEKWACDLERELDKLGRRDAKIERLLFPLSIAESAVNKEQVIVIKKGKYDKAMRMLKRV